ncbi:alpha-glucosidase/alpha-galactosidase [Dactylosporangium matsuzakiense]|uniref:Alpha-glucosidase/alpha-galactosidase n=1 Tax=Dactylosporangium matsuzakiense TaxID=53360 RepID=A0A9W6KJ03_9ACTN|nr:alpha-glucosidase/alpha-galactosidase [Dactylosporangium matsuzakiense]UWZ46725.1 alpha-glucosidase/alpha-galactosidase [Dactylosporangium matsuzakiense]GLL01680.1 alpha-glucosidase/alpha-galactosidase [Dactylosporangium matsuzakiense]
MTVIAFLGAGSVVFTRELLADLLSFDELRGVTLALHDIDVERLETAEAIARRTAEQLGAKPVITTNLDRRAALSGASYVINSIQVGMHAATVSDFEVPARYGLRQTIGDTLGVGGIFRALRTFPVLAGIAADMREQCPDAWLLNYTNPMAMNVSYLAAIAPDLNVAGLCHSVFWTVHDLCELLGVPLDEVDYRAAGVNHQAWLLHWEHRGESLYPRLDARLAADPQLQRRVRMDMYRRLGYFPTETSEHSSEYVPWYLHHDSEVERLRIPVGDYLRISSENLAEYAAVRTAVLAGEPLDLHREATEYAPQVIHSMETGTLREIHANVANRGLITNLPEGYGVEVPCLVDRLGVHPQRVGALPPQCAAVNRSFVSVGELTVQAALTGDPRLVRQAAMVDPNTAATLTVDQIWSLCNDLTAAHGSLLPEPLRTPVTL